MWKLKLYLWALNRDKGTDVTLVEVDGSYLVSGTLHTLTEVSIATANKLVLVETIRLTEKLAKAHYKLQSWKGAQAVTALLKHGIPERVATEFVSHCIRTGRDLDAMVKHPEVVKMAAAKLEELMDRE